MRDTYHDLETRSPVPIKHGTHRYAEEAEILLWTYASDKSDVGVWDVMREDPPLDLVEMWRNPDDLIWFHNGGMFDFVVIEHARRDIAKLIPQHRRRDTMVQAYCHGLPGKLDKLCDVLKISEDKRKLKTGTALMRFFCIPRASDGEFNKPEDWPDKWRQFIEYAQFDVVAMREVHRKVPMWNYKGNELALWHLDMKINSRGVAVDADLARAAVRASKQSLDSLADETEEITEGGVASATQRDALLKWILAEHGVALPDMRADTLERRLNDDSLPADVRALISIRLQASMNSSSKYTALLRGTSSDGRLRGLMQFRGAFRTGRWAHRMFQPGNLMRPPVEIIAQWHRIAPHEVTGEHIHQFVSVGIESMLLGCEDMVFDNVRAMAGTAVRGAIVAPPGRKLVVADLANIEGRFAAWLAGEEWKLEAYRDYDTVIGVDAKGKAIRKGPDLYVKAYASSFNVAVDAVTKDMRQIGKVQELMFQYQGGVGAWITGAATYGIDLPAMTDAVWPVLPEAERLEAAGFLAWRYEEHQAAYNKAVEEGKDESLEAEKLEARKLKARYGLTEKTFIACDTIKRLWRKAHPQITSYWDQLENTVKTAIYEPGVTFRCRKLLIRRDGAWLRIGLPSGRALCYPYPKVKNDKITFMGVNTYTRTWGEVHTYGGKLFENVVQAGSCDILGANMPSIEHAGYDIAFHVHDELVCETPDTDEFTAEDLSDRMAVVPEWAEGLPLAAAGFETVRYYKG